ncbi:hypothetical protein PGT21_009579 [Puccinia graminis f. sp. tritici]|uniref:Rgp1-domain-containing protein n=1 Tax=Puccinia graminis f. sp. tritici TaxID=56615 RepID=A0A5B0P9R0_PUCGR|nr:hypothetical protein PGT21_009579 [Puccinia graminis f. sp. tritici]KAA1134119.1 hypothetical protein PGTUg99_028142 [Puccinia graminis f. sp. tritici]
MNQHFSTSTNPTHHQQQQQQQPHITITVTPNKSAYFAGEKFECTIELKHHHQQQQQPTNNLTRLSAATSILSPSTTTSSSSTTTPAAESTTGYYHHHHPPRLKRQGLIGSSIPNQPQTTQPTHHHHHHHHPKSLSIHNLESSFPNPSFSFSIQEPATLTPPNSNTQPTSPKTGGALGEEGKAAEEYLPTPRKTSTPSVSAAYSRAIAEELSFNPRRASLHAIGVSAPAHRTRFSTINTPASSSTVLLGWTYCQLEGSFEVSPKHFNLDQFQSLRHPQTRGGGRLLEEDEDDHHHQQQQSASHKSSSSSWINWLFGNSSNPLNPSSASSNRFPVFQNPISLLDVDVRLEPGQSRSYSFSIDLPIDLPPTHRGKLIKFNYELIVGTNLLSPPDSTTTTTTMGGFANSGYRAGRSSTPTLSADPFKTRFSTPSSPFYPRHKDHKNRTFRVPIKVFNHVSLNQTRPVYDLFKPIISTRDIATTRRILSNQDQPSLLVSPKPKKPAANNHPLVPPGDGNLSGLAGLETYGLELLKTVGKDHLNQLSPSLVTRDVDALEDGCLTAVAIVSRSAPKVSFDIIKDGRLVAQLTVVKAVYRLGETIEGSISMNGSMNEREGGRVVRYGVSLESIETLKPHPSSPSTPHDHHQNDRGDEGGGNGATGGRSSRKVYSEMEELVVDSARVRFSLVVPNLPAPAFDSSLISFTWAIKLRLLFISLPPPSNHLRGAGHSGSSVYSHLAPFSISHGTFLPVPQLGARPSYSLRPETLPSSSPSSPELDHSDRSLTALNYESLPLNSTSLTLDSLALNSNSLPLNSNPQSHPSSDLPPYSSTHAPNHLASEDPNFDVQVFHCDVPVKILPSNTLLFPTVHSFSLS